MPADRRRLPRPKKKSSSQPKKKSSDITRKKGKRRKNGGGPVGDGVLFPSTRAPSKMNRKTAKKISQKDYFAMVEKKAYEFYVERGYTDGNDANDWYEAEKFVKASLGK